jgi:hypothetical protein
MPIFVRLLLTALAAGAAAGQLPDLDHFESKIRPLLAQRCQACHGAEKQFAGLRLDSRDALLRGGKSGPAIVPGDAARSLLMRGVRGEALRMPPDGELPQGQIDALASWIEAGAPWPEATQSKSTDGDRYSQLVREHWAFQPVGRPAPPDVADPLWAAHPIDRFIRARLDERGLMPAPQASRQVLTRRLSYLLTGLPPSAEDVRQFAADDSPDAYDNLVSRLLASPHYGERWGRHWLDLVRYAETRGYEWNYEIVGAWRYRDYVVRAFNSDVPYDQLVREHIAGDLLAHPRINREENLNESVIGTAFYRLGEAGHDDCVQFREIALDVVDNQIDVLSKTFQGMTVACARCHDHKLDPIPSADYYGLYGILNSSRPATLTIDTAEARAPGLAELRSLKARIRAELADIWSRQAGNVAEVLRSAAANAEAEPALDDPAQLIHAITAALGQGTSFDAAFSASAERIREEGRSRAERNAKDFESFGDFRVGIPAGWTADGLGLRAGASAPGELAVASQGDAAVRGIYPAGAYTFGLSARLNGALRSPTLPRGPKKLSLLVVGGMLGARRTVVDNCAIGEDYAFLDAVRPQWVTVDIPEKWGELPAFVELVTRWDNPRIPDRPDKIKEPQLALIDAPESYFGVMRAILHDGDEPPQWDLGHLAPLLEGPSPASWADLDERYGAVTAKAVERWARSEASDEDAVWLSWMLEKGALSNRADASPKLAALIERYRRLEETLPEPRVIDGLEDAGPGRDFPVLLSGAAGSPGEPAPRRFLSRVLGGETLPHGGSGRRALADAIAGEANPLTARVMVNRIWGHLFGRGLVATADDFGSLGERPSHPELLDFLARRLMEDGWSVKRLIRFIVTSRAFRQSGQTDAASLEADPQNALLHHFPVRRLSAEEIRDSLLAAAGELRPVLYGPSVDPYRKQAKDYRRLFSGPLLGDGRRSLYLKVTRMEGPAFLETFDFPMPSTTRGSRDTTTVPAQSLALLNDPFVLEAAERCAKEVLAGAGPSTRERIDGLFRAILARDPSKQEHERFSALADRMATLSGGEDELHAWRDLAHVLLNTQEFLYVE